MRRRATKAPCNRSWPCTVSPLKPSSPCSRCRPRCSRRFPGSSRSPGTSGCNCPHPGQPLGAVAKCRASGQARGPALGQAKHLAQVQVWIPACRFRRLGAGHLPPRPPARRVRADWCRKGILSLGRDRGRPRLCRSNCQRHAVLTSLRRRCPRRRCPRRRRLRFHRHVPPFLRRCLRLHPRCLQFRPGRRLPRSLSCPHRPSYPPGQSKNDPWRIGPAWPAGWCLHRRR